MSNFAAVMTTRFSEKLKVVSFMAILAVFYLHATFPEEVNTTMRIPVLVRQCIADVFGHCAVPMFYAISGYLFFRGISQFHQVFDKMKKRVFTLLVPFVIAALLFTLLYVVIEPTRFAGKSIWAILYAIFYDAGTRMPLAYHLWCSSYRSTGCSPIRFSSMPPSGLWLAVCYLTSWKSSRTG